MVPPGWALQRALPALPPPSEPAPLTLTLRLRREPPSAPPLPRLAETSGWVLEGDEETFRWTLPDAHGGWFWRLTCAPDRRDVELGPELVDRGARRFVDPVTYPLDQIVVIHHLHQLDGLLLHAAGIARGGSAVAAVGVSGAGKSTVARLLRTVRPELAGLSDDRVIAAPRTPGPGAEWDAWGTPWAGEGRIASHERARLSALVLLRHADARALRPLEPDDALARIVPAVSIPWYSPPLAERALQTLAELVAAVPVWELAFRPLPGDV